MKKKKKRHNHCSTSDRLLQSRGVGRSRLGMEEDVRKSPAHEIRLYPSLMHFGVDDVCNCKGFTKWVDRGQWTGMQNTWSEKGLNSTAKYGA